jgi:tetratricopeptide (TPR) repeat protein
VFQNNAAAPFLATGTVSITNSQFINNDFTAGVGGSCNLTVDKSTFQGTKTRTALSVTWAPFNLGNMLRAAARTVEAEAALRAATRANPAFAEAWYNLADLLDDQGRSEAAIECLRKALLVAPDYIDAMFNLALLLQRKGAYAEAADYWRWYLASDRASEWAARARRSLKFCEIQINSRFGRTELPAGNSDQAA